MTLEEVRDQFDIPRLQAFNAYSERFPPLHVLVAAYFGYGKDKPKPAQDTDIADLMVAFPMVPR